ncbi:hypothetical protein HU200_029361 [Digitaria exilis]|uniref:Pentatricopeptide repeat-containing protein n=1 Tax=Digitaria exilis TaxID=1010633 RepID=A0A835C4U1_9POAL|nr:hypothetical protein HU200_029361 [Digitaria exilis]
MLKCPLYPLPRRRPPSPTTTLASSPPPPHLRPPSAPSSPSTPAQSSSAYRPTWPSPPASSPPRRRPPSPTRAGCSTPRLNATPTCGTPSSARTPTPTPNRTPSTPSSSTSGCAPRASRPTTTPTPSCSRPARLRACRGSGGRPMATRCASRWRATGSCAALSSPCTSSKERWQMPSLSLGQEWLDAGEMVHGFVIKLGFDANLPLVNALIAMYGKCGRTAMAEALFEGMMVRTLVSWNTMVAMYEQHGNSVEAIKFFRRMLTQKVGFDCVTLVSVLSACARSGALDTGKWVHEFARSHGLDTDPRIGNVLVDMYAKCGAIANARQVFDCLNVRGVVAWSAMISAYANHGESAEALKLFSVMNTEGVRPNSFTFTAVLVACGNSGLVDEGLKHFNSILTDYQMSPTLEHYTCMVDMLGRSGRLVEAYELIRGMSMPPDKCVWGAFLGGCRLHGNLELAEFVAKDLFISGSIDVTFYVLMSNMYFEAGMREDAERMRRAMKDMELKKTAGRSAVNQ